MTRKIIAAYILASIICMGCTYKGPISLIFHLHSINISNNFSFQVFASEVSTSGDVAKGHVINSQTQVGTTGIKKDIDSNISSFSLVQLNRHHVTVYLGGANKFSYLANDVAASVKSGKIALYEHANGLAALTAEQRQAVQAAWSSTGAKLTSGGGTAMGEIGEGFSLKNIANFGGAFPAIDTINMNDSKENYTATSSDAVPKKIYQHYISASYVTQAQDSFLNTMNRTGAKLLLPFIPVWIDTDDLFSKGGYYENARKLALISGGIALDLPSNDALMNGDVYINAIADAIKWAENNHLAAVLVLSPYTAKNGNCGYQSNLLQTSQTVVTQLRHLGAVPTAYVAENYCQKGEGSTVNTASGDSVLQSLNQLALWLTTQPVAIPGTIAPIGGLSESQISTSAAEQSFTPLITNTSRSLVPRKNLSTQNFSPRNQIYTQEGDLAYQSSNNFFLISGTLGDGDMLKKPIKIFLNTLSSFTTQAPLTLQGSGNLGNQSLQGGSDQYAHLMNNFNSVVGNIGLKLGIDTSAPLMYRMGKRFAFRDQVYIGSGLLMQGTTPASGNEEISVLSDGMLHLTNNYVTTDYTTGIGFGDTISSPSISVTKDKNTLRVKAKIITLKGITAIQGMRKANILAITLPLEGMIVNDSDDHVPVIYENGHWYPVKLGSALQ